MFRVPTWRMSAYSATMSTWFGLHDLGDDRQPGPVARLGEVAQGLDAQALEGVRAGPRLEGAAAEDRRAGRGDRVGRLEELVAALDRARSGHHGQRAVADDRVEDADDGVLGVELARGELERPADRRDRRDPGSAAKRSRSSRLPRADLADDGDDAPLGPTWSYGVRPSARIWLLTLSTSASLAPTVITTNIAVGSPRRSAGQTKKQRSDLCFVRPARPVPLVSDQEPSCRASKVEAVAHVRARSVPSDGPMSTRPAGRDADAAHRADQRMEDERAAAPAGRIA